MDRAVDRAMAEQRPEKARVRQLWLAEISKLESEIREMGGSDGSPRLEDEGSRQPLYLTLPGAEGLEVALLVEASIIKLTSVGAIAKNDQWKIVAVESSQRAILELQTKYPGLKILQGPIQNLVHGASPTAWPDGDARIYCQAAVVNLDLNEPLRGEVRDGHTTFPVLDFAHKFSVLHRHPFPQRWILLLTLHAEILGDATVFRAIKSFLVENCGREKAFKEGAQATLGVELLDLILGAEDLDFDVLDREDCQKIIGIFVPKKLAQLVDGQGWRLRTKWNLRYGGSGSQAPIVTWVLEFAPEPESSSNPDRAYRESLMTIFDKVARIEEDGSIQA